MSFFSLLPPEINSGLIYAGAGAGSLTAAATAWNGLSEELATTAGSISHVVAGLGGSWTGPSAAAMASTTSPFTGWLYDASALAGQMGAQATAQAGLYQTAHAAVVPPAAIVANRARLLMLIATNFFGQNSAAIAATEAEYQTYWATDAAVMDSYSSATQANMAAMKQPTAPPAAAQAQSAPSLAVGNPTTTTIPTTGTTSSGVFGATVGDILAGWHLGTLGLPASVLAFEPGLIMSTGYLVYPWYYLAMFGSMPVRYLMMLSSMGRMGATGAGMGGMGTLAADGAGATAQSQLMTQIGEFVDGKLQGAVGTLVGHFSSATHEISAKLGQAASMGALKVPQAWSMAADGMVRAAPVLPNTTVSAPIQTAAASGLPGGPFGNALMGAMAGRGLGGVAAKAPKVIPRSPAGG